MAWPLKTEQFQHRLETPAQHMVIILTNRITGQPHTTGWNIRPGIRPGRTAGILSRQHNHRPCVWQKRLRVGARGGIARHPFHLAVHAGARPRLEPRRMCRRQNGRRHTRAIESRAASSIIQRLLQAGIAVLAQSKLCPEKISCIMMGIGNSISHQTQH